MLSRAFRTAALGRVAIRPQPYLAARHLTLTAIRLKDAPSASSSSSAASAAASASSEPTPLFVSQTNVPHTLSNASPAVAAASRLTNDPHVDDIEDLRRQYGLKDPMDPDFKFNENSRPAKFFRISFWIMLPLALYHLNLTFRDWVDTGIAELKKLIDEQQAKQKAANAQNKKDGVKAAVFPTLSFTTARAEEKKAEPVTAAVTPKAAAASAAAPVASFKADADAAELASLQHTLETLKLLELAEKIAALEQLERQAAVAASIPPTPEKELPATVAIRNVEQLDLSSAIKLQLTKLPQMPQWTHPPLNADEARQRLDQLKSFKVEFELAASKQLSSLRAQLQGELNAQVQRVFEHANDVFDNQLPNRLRHAAHSTKQALENQSLSELAQLSREITQQKAAEWRIIIEREVKRQKENLAQATEDVLAKSKAKITGEYEKPITGELKNLENLRAEIKAIEKELNRKKKIEVAGEKIHALTSLLIHMEENVQRETKAPLFISSQQAASPGGLTTRRLEEDWESMKKLITPKSDPTLFQLLNSVPKEYLSASSHTPLRTPSALRLSYNREVESAVREASFLPEGEAATIKPTDSSEPILNPLAIIVAKVFSAFTLKEGQALRPNATTDADHLNNASYYVNRARVLSKAIGELEQMSPRAKQEAQEWIAQAKQRVVVEDALAHIRENIEQTAKTYAKNIK